MDRNDDLSTVEPSVFDQNQRSKSDQNRCESRRSRLVWPCSSNRWAQWKPPGRPSTPRSSKPRPDARRVFSSWRWRIWGKAAVSSICLDAMWWKMFDIPRGMKIMKARGYRPHHDEIRNWKQKHEFQETWWQMRIDRLFLIANGFMVDIYIYMHI